jgi:hypothetical protein
MTTTSLSGCAASAFECHRSTVISLRILMPASRGGSPGRKSDSRTTAELPRRDDKDTQRFEACDPDLTATWNPDGALELAGTTKQLDAPGPRLGAGVHGKHALTFP